TFMANPLACAAANASLDVFEHEPRELQVQAIEAGLRTGLEPCRGLPGVVDIRVKGAVGVVQLAEDVDVDALLSRFVEEGVRVRPVKDLVYLMPPLVISDEELQTLTEAVHMVLRQHSGDSIRTREMRSVADPAQSHDVDDRIMQYGLKASRQHPTGGVRDATGGCPYGGSSTDPGCA